MEDGGFSAPPGMFGKSKEDKAIAALNRIARALERLADAQQQIAEQGEPVGEVDDSVGPLFGHLGQRDE
jgi:hypothetical protein